MNMPLPDTLPHLADVLLKGGLLTLAAAALLPLLARRVSAGYRALILRAVFAVLLLTVSLPLPGRNTATGTCSWPEICE